MATISNRPSEHTLTHTYRRLFQRLEETRNGTRRDNWLVPVPSPGVSIATDDKGSNLGRISRRWCVYHRPDRQFPVARCGSKGGWWSTLCVSSYTCYILNMK